MNSIEDTDEETAEVTEMDTLKECDKPPETGTETRKYAHCMTFNLNQINKPHS